MNLVLFHPAEVGRPLARADARARHVERVLRRGPGEPFDAGIVNGHRGRGRIVAATPDALELVFEWLHPAPVPDPVTLLVGLPRPQTARDILRDATTLGVAALRFVATERTEPGYAASSLWRDRAWEPHVLAGAAQAFSTQVPAVSAGAPLAAELAALPAGAERLALDNYEASAPLSRWSAAPGAPVVLALGPERGWGPTDRAALRAAGFRLVHLGDRVLRLETAVVAALTLVKAAREPR